MSPLYLSLLISSCQLSVFDNSFFQMAKFPTMKTVGVFSVVFGWLLLPHGLLDVVLIVIDWDYVLDACVTNVLDSSTAVDVCKRFSIAHSFRSRLPVVRKMSSSDSQTLLNFWYSEPTVDGICPCSSSICVPCDPRGRSSVFMSENNFSTSVT